MPSIKVETSHQLEKQEAIVRISQLITKLKNDFKDKINNEYESWNGDNANFGFKIMGMNMKGTILVGVSSVVVRGTIPLGALPFRLLIENTIRKEAAKLLA